MNRSGHNAMKSGIVSLLVVSMLLLSACATKTDRETQDSNDASDYNAQLGLAYINQGRYEIAQNKLKKAIEQNPDNAVAHHYMAELYRRLGEFDKAETHFKEALDLAPKNSSLLNNYGVFLCDAKKYKEAYTYFDKVLKDPLYPSKGSVYENIGLCAQSEGNLKTAEENLRFALRLNPQSPKSLLAMAQISFDKQKYAASRKYFYQYLENARHTPASLWLGILLENRSGNKNRVASYVVLLKGKYPDSEEAELLKKMQASGQL
ncbi:MAG: type IV pilus biogenesis/stability protein PilW [Gammaproteobacteria bacterium]|nr:type IV pilus biogenesis/stability protein PilW [Gammaproteobacteria bacterium]